MNNKRTHNSIVTQLSIVNPNIEIVGKCDGTNKPVACKCKICGFEHYNNGEQWTPIPNNLLRGYGCPVCAGRIAMNGYNDLGTLYPELSQQWIKCIGNKNITPADVTKGSHENVLWKCPICGHRWEAKVCDRIAGNGCPQCIYERKTSFAEQAIFYYCRQVTKAYNRYTDFGKEIDVWLPEFNIGIEYNGSFWHKKFKDLTKKDDEKIKYFHNLNIKIITISDGMQNKVDGDIITYTDGNIDWAIKQLLDLIGLTTPIIDIKKDEQLIYEQYVQNKKENSFAIKYPEKAKEWDYYRNGDITPDMVYAGSQKKFWRICPSCKESYQIAIYSWVKNNMCKKCNGLKHSGENNPISRRILLFDCNYNLYNQFNCGRDCGEYMNISPMSVTNRCRDHKPLTFGDYPGYILWYADDWNTQHND